jgi:radical SAM protein with 4Fe4S-binding SPASM domain
MGEALMHPLINVFIKTAINNNFKVNLTTNGYLIDKLEDNLGIRQINISLQSFNKDNGISIDEYLNKIFKFSKKLSEEGTYINYRMWVNNDTTNLILDKLNQEYNANINVSDRTKTLAKNIFYSKEKEFVWPSIQKEEGSNYSTGTCRALKDHIAILVDGTVVPCCLDNDANINLGNIFTDDLTSIINTPLYQSILNGFNNNIKVCDLCKKCNFYDLKK